VIQCHASRVAVLLPFITVNSTKTLKACCRQMEASTQ
jgi:hypothetical protein